MKVQAATVALLGRPVLHNIEFTAGPGELVALCGPNGAGKTTLLKLLAGLLPGGHPEPRRTAYMEQGARSVWGLTVGQIAALGRIPHGDRAAPPVAHALRRCGVFALQDHRIDHLSGGQARRAMLARAFATEPEVFLLDEPTADLDPAAAHEIMALLAETAQTRIVIVVLHAIELALRYATRMVVLNAGRIVADGAPLAVLPHAACAFGLPYGLDPTPRLLPP